MRVRDKEGDLVKVAKRGTRRKRETSCNRCRLRRAGSFSMRENSDDDDGGNIRAADGSSSLVGKWVVPSG